MLKAFPHRIGEANAEVRLLHPSQIMGAIRSYFLWCGRSFCVMRALILARGSLE